MGITAAPGQGEAAVWGDNQASLSIGREGDGGFGDNANGDRDGRFSIIILTSERVDLAAAAKASHTLAACQVLVIHRSLFTLDAQSLPPASAPIVTQHTGHQRKKGHGADTSPS